MCHMCSTFTGISHLHKLYIVTYYVVLHSYTLLKLVSIGKVKQRETDRGVFTPLLAVQEL